MTLKRIAFIAAAAVTFGVTAASAASTRITTETQFNAAVVGKTLTGGKGNEVMIGPGGKMTGMVGGKKITAAKWQWNAGKFCRALATADKEYPSACQNVMIDGNTVTFGSTSWTIN